MTFLILIFTLCQFAFSQGKVPSRDISESEFTFFVCLFVLELVLIIQKNFDLVNKCIRFGWS